MRSTFFCIDGHTAGNPVRLVAGGAPLLRGATMAERRLDFMERFDWIRTGLCFEPRGHDMMSGGFLYPPTRADADVGILFIETSGCLPMCGHGTIGILTFGLEHGLIRPQTPGELRVEVPAGLLHVSYLSEGNRVASVRIRNVASYLVASDLQVELPGFGSLMQWLPDYGIGIVAFGNVTYTSWGGVINNAFDTLAKTGALQPRVQQPSDALVEMRDAVSSLIVKWDDTQADSLAAMNLYLDRSKDRRQRDIAALREKMGGCTAPTAFDYVENALRGMWTMKCERGDLRVSITLAPTIPPRVQYLDVRPAPPEPGSAPPACR